MALLYGFTIRDLTIFRTKLTVAYTTTKTNQTVAGGPWELTLAVATKARKFTKLDTDSVVGSVKAAKMVRSSADTKKEGVTREVPGCREWLAKVTHAKVPPEVLAYTDMHEVKKKCAQH